MSIKVIEVSKNYGAQKALNKVSFEINSGEIVGFLGPNGAGKSTMMKIICNYIPQSEGKVEVCGLDVLQNSLATKNKIGYLPEHNPLYLEMYVQEFLAFIADIHKIKNKKERIEEMIQLTGLDVERKKKISELSKGYRQRVGLAAAIIHDPEVLILDEPTTGLDPNQIVDIRNLIKEIGKTKTVMLSTHIMQEVEAICNRAIIIKKGEIVADNKIEQLQNQNANQIVHVEFDKPMDVSKIEKQKGVKTVKTISEKSFLVESESNQDIRAKLSQLAIQENNLVVHLSVKENSLENVFQTLTK